MQDTRHPLAGNHRSGFDNLNEGLADGLEAFTHGLADVLGDMGKGLVDYLNRLTGQDKDKDTLTPAEKAEGYATTKTWAEHEPDPDKRRALDQAAEHIRQRVGEGSDHQAEATQEREHTITVPQYIKDAPDYETTLAKYRAEIAQEMARYYQAMASMERVEAADAREDQAEHRAGIEARQDPTTPGVEGERNPYAQDAAKLEAQPVKEGQEVEGEVLEVAKVADRNYYLVEQDGERYAVPAGKEPAYEAGDEITASHGKEGVEVEEAYGYGR